MEEIKYVSARKVRKNLERTLLSLKPGTPQYEAVFADYCTIRKIENENKNAKFKISGDVLIAAGCNLACVYMIVHAEETMAVVSKALQFIPKFKPII